MEGKLLIRKDLRTLKKWESERFWACMIYLHIMPPIQKHPQTKKPLRIAEVYYTSFSFRDYEPLNRYDEFVSSHASCCEHMTNYFGHYHRHLLTLLQLALNEADQSIRRREVFDKFNNLEYREVFQNVFNRYEQIIEGCKSQLGQGQSLPFVALHYWNPMNYKERIQYPEFLQEKEREGRSKTDPFWILHEKYLKCDYGEKNFKHTWNKGEQFDYNSIWIASQRSSSQYNDQEQQILDGKFKRNGQLLFSLPLLKRKIPRNKLSEAFENIYRTGKTPLCLLTEEELNIQYGGGQYRWFSYEQLKERFNYSSYNLGLPHFVFAESLAIPNRNFCGRILPWGGYAFGYLVSFQDTHNQMHDYLSFSMMDGSFSILSPLFFIYHSFIDYLLQLKIRLVREDSTNSAYKSVQRFCNTQFTWRINRSRSARNDEVRTILNIFSQDGIMKNFGDYPVLEWLDTKAIVSRFQGRVTSKFEENINYQACKTYKQFMIDAQNKKIRQTNEIMPFYENTRYEKVLQDYPFNYNYDALPLGVDPQSLIPEHIQQIKDENESQEQFFVGKVASRIPTSSGIPLLQENEKQFLKSALKKNKNKEEKVQVQPEKVSSLKEKIKLYNEELQKYNSFYAFIYYPTNIDNEVINLSVKIKDLQNFRFENSKALSSDLETKIKNSNGLLPIKAYTIFLRGERSQLCPKCTSFKFQVKNLLQNFKGYLSPFYIDLMVNSNYGLLYHSLKPKQVQKSFQQLIELKQSSTSKHFRFQLLEGAPELTFNVKFVEDIDKEQSERQIASEIKVSLRGYIYDVLSKQQLFCVDNEIVLKQKSNSILKFNRLSDITTTENKKLYLFRDFECSISHEEKQRKIEFSLKNFYENPSYNILIDDNLNIAIKFAQLLEKRKYLW